MFLIALILINIFGVLGYGEEEFWASALKLAAIVIFMIVALVLILGGGPSDGRYSEYWGARYVRLLGRSLKLNAAGPGTTLAPSITASRASAPSSLLPRSPSLEPSLLVWLQLSPEHH